LQLYDHGAATHRKGACCAGQDIHDARAVAERIGIPHYVLDYEARFKEAVIDRFAASYAAGETPVPCIECNRAIKFNDLLATARDLGARVLATGHYAVNRRLGDGARALYQARETGRDQSYFLFATTAEQLEQTRFPLGDRPKAETRELAHRFGLSVADKPDSQDICFVPNGDYASVVQKLRPEAAEPGEIVDRGGRVVGHHDGIVRFTVGQRRGLALGGREGTDNEPLYVVRLEPETRRVVVGPRSALGRSEIALYDVNWLGPRIDDALPVKVRVRSSQALRPAEIRLAADGATVRFVEPEIGVSPGQACVVYDADNGSRVLGGGFIRRFAS
jgi:tRNA-specific 2-thiouridylase